MRYRQIALRETKRIICSSDLRPTERFVQKNNNLSLNSITLGYSLQADSYRWLKTAE